MKFHVFIPVLFLYHAATSQVAKRLDVVIHELMADPAPQVGLPNSEFIELRNVSAAAFNLRNWKISDGSSTSTINVNYILQPDSCVIICPSAALAAFSALGPAISVTGFPSLNNDADVITLVSPEGRTIHSIAYDISWFQNAVKSDGGWALEMIDAHNPCGTSDNWGASRDPAGGTPGRKNSIEAIRTDRQPPALVRTYTIDSVTIAAVFDEPLDNLVATQASSYSLDKGIAVTNALPLAPLFRQVMLQTAQPLLKNMTYTLTVSGITDCAGNSIGLMNSARVGLPADAGNEDAVINEVLFNPAGNGTDYIELYNRSGKVLDAAALFIGQRNSTGNIGAVRKLSEQPFLFFPGDHLVFTENPALAQAQYVVQHPGNLLVLNSMPSLPDDKGNIILLNAPGDIIDELSYDEDWHFPLLHDRQGVALERIDPGRRGQDRINWTSAASDVRYGTPTYRNSQYRSSAALQGRIDVTPAVFSPDNDGRDDHCFIHYQLAAPGKVGTVTVYDVDGNVVRDLSPPATLSEKGFFRWDGLNNKGDRVPSGIYIIHTLLFDLGGSVKNFKNTVTLTLGF
jgi:hypothetical protein